MRRLQSPFANKRSLHFETRNERRKNEYNQNKEIESNIYNPQIVCATIPERRVFRGVVVVLAENRNAARRAGAALIGVFGSQGGKCYRKRETGIA